MYPNTPDRPLMALEAFSFRVSVAYLIFDTFFGLWHGYNDIFMIVHHAIMLSVYFYSLYL
jgi:environmental stress-induced protein Ves